MAGVLTHISCLQVQSNLYLPSPIYRAPSFTGVYSFSPNYQIHAQINVDYDSIYREILPFSREAMEVWLYFEIDESGLYQMS